jgi:hypothetical protein
VLIVRSILYFIFGVASWFLIYAVGSLYKVPLLEKSTPQTSIAHLISAAVFGFIVGYFEAWAAGRVTAARIKRENFAQLSVPSPAYKIYEDPSREEDSKTGDE